MATKMAKQAELFKMAGTEETYEYVVVAVSKLGRVGVRNLGGGQYRVRLEPSDLEAAEEMQERFADWKQPNNEQFRFSTVATGEFAMQKALRSALQAIKAVKGPRGGKPKGVKINEAAPERFLVCLGGAPGAQVVTNNEEEGKDDGLIGVKLVDGELVHVAVDPDEEIDFY